MHPPELDHAIKNPKAHDGDQQAGWNQERACQKQYGPDQEADTE
jgi:hypothetical protein